MRASPVGDVPPVGHVVRLHRAKGVDPDEVRDRITDCVLNYGSGRAGNEGVALVDKGDAKRRTVDRHEAGIDATEIRCRSHPGGAWRNGEVRARRLRTSLRRSTRDA